MRGGGNTALTMPEELSTPTVPQELPESPPADTQEPEESPTYQTQDLEAHLAKLSHEELAKLPAYNAQLSRMQNRLRREAQQQAAQAAQSQAQEMQVLAQWDQHFTELARDNPAQLVRERENPQTEMIYRRIQQVRQSNPAAELQARTRYAEQMLAGLKEHFTNHPEWGKIIEGEWDRLTSEISDPADFLAAMGNLHLEHNKKSAAKEIQAAVDAEVNRVLAEYHIKRPSPKLPQSTSARAGTGTLTLEQYHAMTPSQRQALDPEVIDRMVAEQTK